MPADIAVIVGAGSGLSAALARACAKRAPARKQTPAGPTPARSSGCDHQSRFSLPLRYERSVHLASTA